MMDASLDTDIVIHLYKSGKKELLYSSFDKFYMYNFLVENELKRKSYFVYEEFKKDVELGIVTIIKDKDLRAMGIAAFTTDDTKDYGPHLTLVKELIEGVIPFAFYELLFLKYLNSELTVEQFYNSFQQVNDSCMSEHPMSFRRKISETVKRFSNKNGTERDKKWIAEFCSEHCIDLKLKMIELKSFIGKL